MTAFSLRYDFWVGAVDGVPTFFGKHLFHWRGYRIDLHKFVGTDGAECFHTHPAWAVRLVLWGGYVEEVEYRGLRTWRPGMIGIVAPEFSHRLHRLRNGRVSYSLWFRVPKSARTQLHGLGWKDVQNGGRYLTDVKPIDARP